VEEQATYHTTEENRGIHQAVPSHQEECGDRQEHCNRHPKEQDARYGTGQAIVGRIAAAYSCNPVQPAYQSCSYENAEPAGRPGKFLIRRPRGLFIHISGKRVPVQAPRQTSIVRMGSHGI
jgi:hypothetical protein